LEKHGVVGYQFEFMVATGTKYFNIATTGCYVLKVIFKGEMQLSSIKGGSKGAIRAIATLLNLRK